jgi:hypothetical protein
MKHTIKLLTDEYYKQRAYLDELQDAADDPELQSSEAKLALADNVLKQTLLLDEITEAINILRESDVQST